MAKLAHPNVVNGVRGRRRSTTACTSRWSTCAAATLRAWLAQEPRGWREIVAMLVATGRGLAAAHAAGLVHRDFKPENVLVGDDGRPRVGDFGLARSRSRRDDVDRSGETMLAATRRDDDAPAIAGTPAYMAPEQMTGERRRRALRSVRVLRGRVGVPVRQAAVRRRDARRAQLTRSRSTARAARSSVPERVRAVIGRGLAAGPADRFADMPALLAALERAAAPRTTRNAIAIATGVAVLLGGGTRSRSRALAAHRHAAGVRRRGRRDARAVRRRRSRARSRPR